MPKNGQPGARGSDTSYSFNNERLLIIFNTHWHSGAPNTGATSNGTVYFRVSKQTGFAATGDYVANGLIPGLVTLRVSLTDLETSSLVFFSEQSSLATADEFFVLMGSGGDWINISSGARSGLLVPGRDYKPEYTAFIFQDSNPEFESLVIATGDIALDFFTPAPVGTLPLRLALMLLLGIAGFRRIRAHRR